MPRFLFVYGYESPSEFIANERDGTDFESSGAVWITAGNESAATACGRLFAESTVASLFAAFPELPFPGWAAANYACWIEQNPQVRYAASELDAIPEMVAD
jgi:hypothetical protein